MTAKTDGAAARRSGARASGRSAARAAAVEQPSRTDLVARGKDARAVAPLDSHAEFRAARSRDPVGLLLGQAQSRVPVRHGRMLVSAFTSYRGRRCRWRRTWPTRQRRGCGCSCAGMRTCQTSARSPRRNGGWCSTSTTSMRPCPARSSGMSSGWPRALRWRGRDDGFAAKARRKIVLAAAEGYRTAMLAFAEQPMLDVWYTHVDIEQAIREVRSQVHAKRLKAGQKLLAKAHTSDSTKVLRKLTTMDGGRPRIISDPPMIMPIEEVLSDVQADAVYKQIQTVLGGSGKFDQAIADFAETYADQNERDYAALQAAVKEGKVESATEI